MKLWDDIINKMHDYADEATEYKALENDDKQMLLFHKTSIDDSMQNIQLTLIKKKSILCTVITHCSTNPNYRNVFANVGVYVVPTIGMGVAVISDFSKDDGHGDELKFTDYFDCQSLGAGGIIGVQYSFYLEYDHE